LIQLFEFQQAASALITGRYLRYAENRPLGGTQKHPVPVPFYQALAAITASGKTPMLSHTVSQIQMSMPVKPVILWLSKGRVVVEQTYTNLQEGGKYHHLLGDVAIQLLAEFNPHDVSTEERTLIYFATVGTFNQKDKEKGGLLIYKSEVDTAEGSTWEELTNRTRPDSLRRPMIVVYDEAHNLTDQQTNLLLELEPDVILVASATMKLPAALAKVLDDLKHAGWKDEELVAAINPADVVEAGLIKRDVLMGGYKAPMETTIDDLLGDMERCREDAHAVGASVSPKAIYVCKSNIVEGNSFKKDDPKRPFKQREAPPILIWRYLVEQKSVHPDKVVVYADVKFDKNYPSPAEFIHLKGGDKDYDQLIAGGFEHIIFNLRLQEGWDDPECYFAYIDKSMGSNIQVEQVVGRLLRQPGAHHYEVSTLNAANFYVRVDAKGVFGGIIENVKSQLTSDGADVEFAAYEAGTKEKPSLLRPKDEAFVPQVVLDATDAVGPIAQAVEDMNDYRQDSGVNTRSEGERALVQQRIGEGSDSEIQWVPYEQNNAVSARWVFQLEVQKRFPRALEVTPSDDEKFDAKIELGSKADKHVRLTAHKVVDLYLDHVRLRQRVHNPFQVGDSLTSIAKMVPFKNALHDGYSGLNKLETPFAKALDNSGTTWARNPARSGFGIPLVSIGKTRNFYPDFLVWENSVVFAIDTTGAHLMLEKAGRKLLSVEQGKSKTPLHVRLVSEGKWSESIQEVDKAGFTVWRLRPDKNLGAIHCSTIEDAVRQCFKA
jgi:type III restriction enzyme